MVGGIFRIVLCWTGDFVSPRGNPCTSPRTLGYFFTDPAHRGLLESSYERTETLDFTSLGSPGGGEVDFGALCC